MKGNPPTQVKLQACNIKQYTSSYKSEKKSSICSLPTAHTPQELAAIAFTNKLSLWSFPPLPVSVKTNPGRLSIL